MTLRGPLYGVPPSSPLDTVGSTIQIEVSNAHSLAALDGQRTVEGLTIGTALMATIATARTGNLLHAGASHLVALDRGIQLAFATAIAFPVFGLIVSLFLLRQRRRPVVTDPLQTATAVASGAEC